MSEGINLNISVDCVIFGFDFTSLKVLLVERSIPDSAMKKGFHCDYTLAGNHILEFEDICEAASRIVKSLTGLENIYLEQFQAFAHPDRLKRRNDRVWLKHIGHNPENRVITVGYYALLNSNNMEIHSSERKVVWYPVNAVPDLAFDHYEILIKALESLRSRMQLSPIAFQLLPEKFTLSQLQQLYEVIFGIPLDKRNFRKKVLKLNYIVALKEKQTNVSHKPARFYRFDRRKYDRIKKEFFDFTP